MKIGNIELTKENMAVVVVVGIAAVFLAIYAIFYAPLLKDLKSKYSECRARENQVLGARNVIDSAGKIYGERVLMTERDVSLAIDELAKHGKAMGINFRSINPKEIVMDKTAQYKILPIEMQVGAKDEQFANFLGSLDGLKEGLIKVKSFDVIPDEDDRTRLNADVIVDMYISGKSYAE